MTLGYFFAIKEIKPFPDSSLPPTAKMPRLLILETG